MKKYIIFISCLIFSTVFFSCEDFLEKPISSDITVDSVFNSTIRTEQFLWNVYSTASIYEFNHFWSSTDPRFYHYGASGSLVSVATDELEVEGTYPAIPRYFHTGNLECGDDRPRQLGIGIYVAYNLPGYPECKYFY